MISIKSLRRWLSSWLAMAILFTQIATSAYACPLRGGDQAMIDADLPSLCIQHCQGDVQTIDQVHIPSIYAPALLGALVVGLPDVGGRLGLEWIAQWRSNRERAPPVAHSILHCCFRI